MARSSSNLLDLVIDKCRICLEHHGSISIFNTPRLAEDIRLCTHICVKTDDPFPKNICITCKRSISAAKALRKIALGTLAKLRYITGETAMIEPILPDILIVDTKNNNEEPLTKVIKKENKSKNRHKKGLLGIPRQKISYSKNDIKEKILISSNEMKVPKIILIANNYADSAYEIKKGDLVSKVDSRTELLQSSFRKEADSPVSSATKKKTDFRCQEADSPVSSATKKKTDFRCQKCGRNCPSRHSLFLHLRSHDASKMLHCPLCEKAFLSKSDLSKHNRTHTGERPFVCRRCRKGFAQNSTLKAHQNLNKCVKITPEKDSSEGHPKGTSDRDIRKEHSKGTSESDIRNVHPKGTFERDIRKGHPKVRFERHIQKGHVKRTKIIPEKD